MRPQPGSISAAAVVLLFLANCFSSAVGFHEPLPAPVLPAPVLPAPVLSAPVLSAPVLSAQAVRAQGESANDATGPAERVVWIGTGRHPLSQGIYVSQLNTQTGKLAAPVLAAEAVGPGWITLHPSGKVLYAAASQDGKPSIIAYTIDRNNNVPTLKLLNAVEVNDGGATHLSVDPSGRMIVSAQYGGGSVAAYRLRPDGSLDRQTQLIDHTGGSKVVPGRQEASHAHWAGFSPDGRYVLVPDLGLDQVVIYKADPATATLEPHGVGIVPPGSGPRHMKFDVSGRWAWVLNELSLTITTFAWDAENGTLTAVETVPTVPEEDKVKEKAVSASEIRIHPNGRFVYSANRGHDTISAFEADPNTGKLTLIERENVRGATPRNFNLDPSGHWLVAAGQDSHTLGVFAVDQSTGALQWTGVSEFAPAAICVVFED